MIFNNVLSSVIEFLRTYLIYRLWTTAYHTGHPQECSIYTPGIPDEGARKTAKAKPYSALRWYETSE